MEIQEKLQKEQEFSKKTIEAIQVYVKAIKSQRYVENTPLFVKKQDYP